LLDPNRGGTIWDRLINSCIVSLIIINTLAVIVETADSFYNHYKPWFQALETLSVIVFSIEYLLRVWVSTSNDKIKAAQGRLNDHIGFATYVVMVTVKPGRKGQKKINGLFLPDINRELYAEIADADNLK